MKTILAKKRGYSLARSVPWVSFLKIVNAGTSSQEERKEFRSTSVAAGTFKLELKPTN